MVLNEVYKRGTVCQWKVYKRVRGWIGCALSTGKKKLWLNAPLRGRGSSVSRGDQKFALSIDHADHEQRVGKYCIQITLSNFTSIHMIYI